MRPPSPLGPDSLRWRLDPRAAAAWLRGQAARARPLAVGQERALRALALGLGMRGPGFHICVVGEVGTGRTTTTAAAVAARARGEPRPPDWCYVFDFDDPDRPRALRLPPGEGRRLAREVDGAIVRLLRELAAAFERESYRVARRRLGEEATARRDRAFQRLEAAARRRGYVVVRMADGFAFGPGREGEILSDEELAKLSARERTAIERRRPAVQAAADAAARALRTIQRELDQALGNLDRAVALSVAAPLFEDLARRVGADERVRTHLDRIVEDVVEHVADLHPAEESAGTEAEDRESAAALTRRWRVNVLVDNGRLRGAPAVHETHPTPENLLGRIERIERGELPPTDFLRVKAGSLHRANGGYLLLDAAELLRSPRAFEGLKRALKSGAVAIEDVRGEGRARGPSAALRPEPIPLAVKVLLVATPDLFAALSALDPDFRKLFKVKAEFEEDMERTPARLAAYAASLLAAARAERLAGFAADGLAALLEHAARLAGDRRRLTAHFGEVLDVAREASFEARRRRAGRVGAEEVGRAIEARRDRDRAAQERRLRMIRDREIRVETTGAVEGQVNGLSVVEVGAFRFGEPSRITARVFVGRRGVLDIERAVRLGGPIHSKGVLILGGLIGDRFGRTRPLRLGATLCFEQSYGGVEGDSASLAEALALISALARVPARQGIAVTGSIDQRGEVQPVGAVEEKIEGFFEACRARGLDGAQGAIVPIASAKTLMLRPDVVRAAAEGRFRVYAVATIEQAVEILLGAPFGRPGPGGKYPAGTIGAMCERALDEMNRAWRAGRRDTCGEDRGGASGPP
jgi:predicted ATP-dependent protease